MKLLVSDYDGTIKTFDNNPSLIEQINFKMNKNAINKFMESGNTFVISTGRTTNSIKKEIIDNNINYDYLTTYDGSVTFDKKDKIISVSYLTKKFTDDLKQYINCTDKIKYIYKYDEKGLTNGENNLVLIALEAKSHNYYRSLYEDIKSIDESKIYEIQPFRKLIVLKENNTKSDGIKQLIKNANIPIKKEDIYTIGNGTNDLQMLKDYKGYLILLSEYSLFSKTKTISSVHSLIKKINI